MNGLSRRILGIDPGTHRVGFGLIAIEDRQLLPLHFGCLEVGGDTRAQRLLSLRRALLQCIKAYQPTEAAVEELFFAKNVTTALKVAEARGVILATFAEIGIPVREYTPNQVKLAVTGFGAAPKLQVQKMVQLLLGLPSLPRPDDAADGLALAICASVEALVLKGQRSVERGAR